MTWEYYETAETAVRKLKEQGYTLVAIEQTEQSVMLDKFIPQAGTKYAFVFGNEVKGVQQQVVDLCDMCVEIPQFGTKHSLNVSISVGIVLWDVVCKLKLKQD